MIKVSKTHFGVVALSLSTSLCAATLRSWRLLAAAANPWPYKVIKYYYAKIRLIRRQH